MLFGEDNDVINRTLRNDGLDIWEKDEETKIQEKNWGVLDRFMARIELVRWLCGYLAYEFLLPPKSGSCCALHCLIPNDHFRATPTYPYLPL